nr:unnamed protein product [Callosobruchus analis]
MSFVSGPRFSEIRGSHASFALVRKSILQKTLAMLTVQDVVRIRPSDSEELRKIYNKPAIEPMFGEIDIKEILAKSYLALGVKDPLQNMVGAILVNTYPNIKALPPWEWQPWIKNIYGLDDACSRNTLWIHLMMYDPMYSLFFLKPLVHYIFQQRVFLEYLIVVLPTGKYRTDILGDLGTVVMPKEEKSRNGQRLYVFNRENFVLKYKIRRAVEEDNDDLVPLINTHSLRLEEMYGRYYIAEILTRYKDSGRQIIVAEHEGNAVAVLCLNESVCYKVLNEEFELTCYNGLKKPHPDDLADLSLDAIYHSLENLNSRYEDEILDIIERTTALAEEPEGDGDGEETFVHVDYSESDSFSLVFTSASLLFFQDDDLKSRQHSVESSLSKESSQEILKEYMIAGEKDPRLNEDALSAYSSVRGIHTRIPEFHGEPNAFCLEIAAAYPDHEVGLMQLFEAAFETFPDREYCIMAVPSTTPINRLTKFFTRIAPRSTGVFPYELYTLHKSAVLGSVRVVAGRSEHIPAVKRLISTIPNNSLAFQQFEKGIKQKYTPYLPFVFLCEEQVMGIAVLSEETDLLYLQSHYDLSYINASVHKPDSYGVIETLLMNPIFQRHSKFFLRELHRLGDFSVLFYRHTPYDTTEAYRERPLMNLLQFMLPLAPRKLPDYDMAVLEAEECAPKKTIVEDQDPFALYLSTVPNCSVNRHAVNTRIVVVGCSNTALSFLETLLCKQDPNNMVTFNNVTLICASGMSACRVGNRVREAFLIKKYFTDPRHMDMVSLKTYVNVISGKVSKIDKKNQILVINNSSFIPYDMLFLMNGEQFLQPIRQNRIPFVEKPENVFVINNAIEANSAVMKLKQLHANYADPDYVIIVYGHFLQAHATLNGLLIFGIPGKNLVLVEPFPYSMALEKRQRHKVSIYNDPDIDQAVYDHIRAEGIQVYQSYYFIDWEFDPAENVITMAKFESRHHMLELDCMAMFYFAEKEIHSRIYKVINQAGLVYDGRLVIDNKCRTNDPKIYGAGTLTKYSRKYYAMSMSHKHFNRVEIGESLGEQIKSMIIPHKSKTGEKTMCDWNFDMERGDQLVPRYVKPIMRYCRLPGGLYYLSITKPGRRTPLETAISMENYGQVLITGNCRNLSKQGFFRLHLNDNKRVETITCLAKFPIDVYNIYCLWGKHEKLLNNIQLRFEMVLITDLFEFFKEPWAYAIYHDKFNDLLEDLNKLMTSSVGEEKESLVEEVIEAYEEAKWQQVTDTFVTPLFERASLVVDFLKYPCASNYTQKNMSCCQTPKL